MPIYEFKCKTCGSPFNSTTREWPERFKFCGKCGAEGSIKRVWGFSYVRPMQEGYNPSVGKNISNMAQLKSEFARMSDEAEMYTGNPHKFVPIDPMDKETLGVTDEGLASTHDHLVATGQKEPAQRLILP